MSFSYNFEATISGCCWKISYEGPTETTITDILKEKCIATCDGTNVYICEFQLEDMARKAWGNRYASVKDQLPVAMAEILPGTYPARKQVILHTWLALASGCVLSGDGGRTRPPYIEDLAMFYNTNSLECLYSWGTSDSGSRRIVFKSDGRLMERDQETGKLSETKFLPPYDEGFTIGEGVYRESTNIGGISVPLLFEFDGFAPTNTGKSAAELRRINHYSCRVSELHSAAYDQISSELPKGLVLVTDRRFEQDGLGSVKYSVTNGLWPAPDDSHFKKVVAMTPRISLESEVIRDMGLPRRPRWNVTRLIIWILLFLPLGLIVFKGLSDKLKTKRQL